MGTQQLRAKLSVPNPRPRSRRPGDANKREYVERWSLTRVNTTTATDDFQLFQFGN